MWNPLNYNIREVTFHFVRRRKDCEIFLKCISTIKERERQIKYNFYLTSKDYKVDFKHYFVVCSFQCRLFHEGPRHISGVPSMGVFQRDPIPYFREFRRKPWKTPNG